jgi:hypothetical protein
MASSAGASKTSTTIGSTPAARGEAAFAADRVVPLVGMAPVLSATDGANLCQSRHRGRNLPRNLPRIVTSA